MNRFIYSCSVCQQVSLDPSGFHSNAFPMKQPIVACSLNVDNSFRVITTRYGSHNEQKASSDVHFLLVNVMHFCGFLSPPPHIFNLMNKLTFDLWVHIGPFPTPLLCFPPPSYQKTPLFLFLFFCWVDLLTSLVNVQWFAVGLPHLFIYLILLPKLWRNVKYILLLISQHPLRKRQSEDGAAGVTGV